MLRDMKEITKGGSVGPDEAKRRALEIARCCTNPLYYILNYVQLPEVGGEFKYSDVPFHKRDQESALRDGGINMKKVGFFLFLAASKHQYYG